MMKCPCRNCNGTMKEKDGFYYCEDCGCVVYKNGAERKIEQLMRLFDEPQPTLVLYSSDLLEE